MQQLRRIKWICVIFSVLLAAAGIMLLAWPGISMRLICRLVGILVVLLGVIRLFSYFCEDRFDLAFQFDFALGLFALVAGILFIGWPGRVVEVFNILLGVYVLVDGAFKLQTALDARRFGLDRWWGILLLALLTCCCGLLLALSPFEGAAALTRLMGAALLIEGVQNLVIVIYTVRTGRRS